MRIHKDCAAIVAFFIHYLCLLQLDAFCTFQFFSAFRNGAGGSAGREYIILSLGSFSKVIKKLVGKYDQQGLNTACSKYQSLIRVFILL